MGLSSLDSALTGLRVSQSQISVISNNVSNVNTPGFSRKIMSQESRAVNGVTVGVRNTTITRNVDLNLSRDLWTQISSVEQLDVRNTYLSRIEEFHGPPDQELSVAAEISRLKDSFAALADVPEDEFMLSDTVQQAQMTAQKINDLSKFITTLRNDAQNEIQTSVERANQLLEKIASLNTDIQIGNNQGRSVAQAEDQRDEALKELSSLVEIKYFKRGDGVLVIQTKANGVELAGTTAQRFEFNNPEALSAQSYYPDSAAGLYVVQKDFEGDPATSVTAVNITELPLNGKIGGLLQLRDEDFPKQMAQLDELAHKMALRFEQQGLRLFTNSSGVVPGDTAPAAGTPPTPVSYVGFSASIQVNAAIISDPSILQRGTAETDTATQAGSSEVLGRIVEFVFGDIQYMEAGNYDTSTAVDLMDLPVGSPDLQTLLGLSSVNTLVGARDLSGFDSAADFIASTNGAIDPGAVPPTDTVRFSFDSATTGSVDLDVDLGAVNDGAGNFVQDLIDHINAQIGGLGAADQANLSAMNVSFSESPSGQLAINAAGTIAVDITNPGDSMGAEGLTFLGFTDNSSDPKDPTHPYFDIKVGNGEFHRITIEPGDTHAELIDKLILNADGDAFNAQGDTTGVPGLAIDLDQFDAGGANTGYLRLRPGDNYDNPSFGGKITIISGPFQTDGTGTYTGVNPERTGIGAGANVASALFGTFSTSGGVVSDGSPVISNQYSSATGVGSNTAPFRTDMLGPNADISSGLEGSLRLVDYAQKMINLQSQELISIESEQVDEEALKEILETNLLNDSGVNLDEEMANLIVYQTAFSASARVVNAVDELFQSLLELL